MFSLCQQYNKGMIPNCATKFQTYLAEMSASKNLIGSLICGLSLWEIFVAWSTKSLASCK